MKAAREQHDRNDKSVDRVDDEEKGGPADLTAEEKIKRCHKKAEVDDTFDVSAEVKMVNADDTENR
jgi:hypothetical protein